jgi:uncharacterized protein YukE
MSDPLSDPRAQHLLSADVGEISALAGSFHRVAGQAQTAAAGLRGAQHDATWTGAAATAFRSKLGKLPGDLDNVHGSYGAVATALDTYGAHLEPIQTQFRSLSTQLTHARSNLAAAQGQLATARTNLSAATSAPHASPSTPAVVNAHAAVQSVSGTAGRLQDEVSGLENRGNDLLNEFDTIRGAALAKVSDAGSSAPSHHWWQTALSVVGNVVKGAVVNIGKSVWGLISGQGLVDFIEHPGWATFGELVKDIAVTASLVAMIAAPFAAPELAELDAADDAVAAMVGDGAEDAAADGVADTAGETAADSSSSLGDIARGVNTWGNRVALAGNGAGVVDDIGEGRYGAAAIDAGFMILPNVGSMPNAITAIRGFDGAGDLLESIPKAMDAAKSFGDNGADLLGIGDKAADDALKAAVNVKFYNGLRDIGVDSSLAKKIAFGDDVPALHADPVSAMNRAMHLGKPLAYGIDSLVTDPGKEGVEQHFHLIPSDR